MKNELSKLAKRKRRTPEVGTAVHGQGSAKRLVKATGRKTAASKNLTKAIRSAKAAKARSVARASSRGVEAKLRPKMKESQSAQEIPNVHRQGCDAYRCSKAESAEGIQARIDLDRIGVAGQVGAVSAVKVQKAVAPEEASSGPKSPKAAGQPAQASAVSRSTRSLFTPLMGLVRLSGLRNRKLPGSSSNCSSSTFQRTN